MVDGGTCQVVKCSGVSGSNWEYITRLADFVRQHIPHDDDQQLFQLDAQVRHLLLTSSMTSLHVIDERPSRSHDQPATVDNRTSSQSADFSHYDVNDLTGRRHGGNVAVTVLAG